MRFYWIFAGMAVLTTSAWADPARDTLKEITKCADIAGATDRLKCFDAAVPHAQTALSAPEAPPPAQTAQTTEESGGVLGWFGFERPVTKPEDFGKPAVRVADPREITTLSASVTEFARTPSGRALFILDNGQVWRQIDGDVTEVSDPNTGEQFKVAIEKAVFGSYDMKINGHTGLIKVRRLK